MNEEQPQSMPQQPIERPKKKSNKLWYFIILLIALGAIYAMYYFSKLVTSLMSSVTY